MKWSLSLLALAGCVTYVAAEDDFNIEFTRYTHQGCNGISRTHKLDNNNCKNFDYDDGNFKSFVYRKLSW